MEHPDVPDAGRSVDRDRTSPHEITQDVVDRFDATTDPRLRELMQSLVRHLHAFAIETCLTEGEWMAGIEFLTATGRACTATRQEFILLSDTLGLSMVVDAVNHDGTSGSTESTVRGPFYVPGSPERAMGTSIADQSGSGDPVLVSGTVRDTDGQALEGAVIDVWQNASSGAYAVQDPTQPAVNLRGRFRTGPDGRFWFWAVRPTDYAIPEDGPVGAMLRATNRHPWRAAHLHLIISAPCHVSVTTHFFDDESSRLDSDTVFGVKPSLICHFVRHDRDEAGAPDGVDGPWFTLERDVVLDRLVPDADLTVSPNHPVPEGRVNP
jgi:hydroxyquinol 1,2-dioxygenase